MCSNYPLNPTTFVSVTRVITPESNGRSTRLPSRESRSGRPTMRMIFGFGIGCIWTRSVNRLFLRESISLRPNDAIQWRAIHDACASGYRRFDFGEVMEDDHGLAEFKSKWGTQPLRLYRYYYGASTQRAERKLDTVKTSTYSRKLV